MMNVFRKVLQLLKKESTLIVGIIITIILLLVPAKYDISAAYNNTLQAKAEVVMVDNSSIKVIGVITSGEQRCTVKILNGKFKGKEAVGVNLLTGSLENDKIFEVGDKALVSISYQDGTISNVSMIDHYRINYEIILAVILVLFLVIFAGKTGVRSVFSFIITVLALWKLLIPAYLDGCNPILIGLVIVLFLTIIIELFVFGFNKKTLSAVTGCILGILSTCILGIFFTNLFDINGAVMTNSEVLLYSGFSSLSLNKIYMATIFIGASGAIMDIATDITQSVTEVIRENPEISFKNALMSGLRVGRAAMGTMTTTLLLAYAAGCIGLLMTFIAQGIPLVCIFNYKVVAAEILDTLVGSFGLIAVAPFTALTSAFFLTKKRNRRN